MALDKSEVKRIIIQCELATPDGDGRIAHDIRHAKAIQAGYELGLQSERERCAKLCDDEAARQFAFKGTNHWSSYVEGMSDGADECAELIRKGE